MNTTNVDDKIFLISTMCYFYKIYFILVGNYLKSFFFQLNFVSNSKVHSKNKNKKLEKISSKF